MDKPVMRSLRRLTRKGILDLGDLVEVLGVRQAQRPHAKRMPRLGEVALKVLAAEAYPASARS
jgi:hypothetical protein